MWRAVPEGYDPVALSGCKILFQPCQHRAAGDLRGQFGIETDEVDVGVVKRIIPFTAGGQPTRSSILGQIEDVIVGHLATRRCRIGLVVAQGGPKRRRAQEVLKDIKHL